MAARHMLIGVAAGVAGTVVLERSAEWFYRMQGEQSRKREEAVREDYPPTVLAKRIQESTSGESNEQTASKLGRGIQWAMGLTGGVTYALLSRRFPLLRQTAGTPLGFLFWLIDDEVVKTVFKLAPPPQRFPVITHVRGLVAHLAYIMTISAVFNVLNTRMQPRKPWYRRTDWMPLIGD